MGDVLPFRPRPVDPRRASAAGGCHALTGGDAHPTPFIGPFERERREAARRASAQRDRLAGMDAPAALLAAIYAALPPEVRERVRQSLAFGVLAALDGYVAALECTDLAEVMAADADGLSCLARLCPEPAGTPPPQVQP